jgi:hypothetical protein
VGLVLGKLPISCPLPGQGPRSAAHADCLASNSTFGIVGTRNTSSLKDQPANNKANFLRVSDFLANSSSVPPLSQSLFVKTSLIGLEDIAMNYVISPLSGKCCFPKSAHPRPLCDTQPTHSPRRRKSYERSCYTKKEAKDSAM